MVIRTVLLAIYSVISTPCADRHQFLLSPGQYRFSSPVRHPKKGAHPHNSVAPIPMQFVSPLDHQLRLPNSSLLAIRDRRFRSLLTACFLCLLIRRFAPVEGPWSARSGRDVFPGDPAGERFEGKRHEPWARRVSGGPWPCVQRSAGHNRRTRRADQTTRAAGASDE